MVTYIKHIVWRYVKHEPENFRLFNIRRNIMKSLILSDCDHLIKFILFGDEETDEKKVNEKRYIPNNKLWPGTKFLMDDDLEFDEIEDGLEDNEEIKPENNMELAICHCKGKSLLNLLIL